MRIAALVLCLSVPPCASAAAPGSKPPSLKDLAGEWRLVSTADSKRQDAGSDNIRMVVEASGRVRFLFGGFETNSGAFTVAKGKAGLKGIDLNVAGGKVYRGLYAVKDGTLTICFGEAGKPRPAGLKPTGSQWLERWQRTGKAGRPGPAHCGKSTTGVCGDEERSPPSGSRPSRTAPACATCLGGG